MLGNWMGQPDGIQKSGEVWTLYSRRIDSRRRPLQQLNLQLDNSSKPTEDKRRRSQEEEEVYAPHELFE